MKKTVLTSFVIALVAVFMISCSKKTDAAQGVRINQKVYTVIAPNDWNYDLTGSGKYQYLNLTKAMPGATGKISFHAYANISDTPMR